MRHTLLTIITASWTLAGCMSPDVMIENARIACAKIGYTVDSPEYLACVERDVANTQAIMTGALAMGAVNASTLVVADALF